MSVSLIENVTENRGRNGIYFCELLAIDFATWLDVDFKIWVYQRIQEVIFGYYKKHWQAYAVQQQAKLDMAILREKLLSEPTPELSKLYFKALDAEKNARKE